MSTVTVKLPAELYSAIAAALYERANVTSAKLLYEARNLSDATKERRRAQFRAAHAEYMAFTKPDNVTRAGT